MNEEMDVKKDEKILAKGKKMKEVEFILILWENIQIHILGFIKHRFTIINICKRTKLMIVYCNKLLIH